MSSYREFKKFKKNSKSDGYYIVNKKRITNKNIIKKDKDQDDDTINQWMKRIQIKDENPEIMLLYGRGPVFQYQDDFTNRFEGIFD